MAFDHLLTPKPPVTPISAEELTLSVLDLVQHQFELSQLTELIDALPTCKSPKTLVLYANHDGALSTLLGKDPLVCSVEELAEDLGHFKPSAEAQAKEKRKKVIKNIKRALAATAAALAVAGAIYARKKAKGVAESDLGIKLAAAEIAVSNYSKAVSDKTPEFFKAKHFADMELVLNAGDDLAKLNPFNIAGEHGILNPTEANANHILNNIKSVTAALTEGTKAITAEAMKPGYNSFTLAALSKTATNAGNALNLAKSIEASMKKLGMKIDNPSTDTK